MQLEKNISIYFCLLWGMEQLQWISTPYWGLYEKGESSFGLVLIQWVFLGFDCLNPLVDSLGSFDGSWTML